MDVSGSRNAWDWMLRVWIADIVLDWIYRINSKKASYFLYDRATHVMFIHVQAYPCISRLASSDSCNVDSTSEYQQVGEQKPIGLIDADWRGNPTCSSLALPTHPTSNNTHCQDAMSCISMSQRTSSTAAGAQKVRIQRRCRVRSWQSRMQKIEMLRIICQHHFQTTSVRSFFQFRACRNSAQPGHKGTRKILNAGQDQMAGHTLQLSWPTVGLFPAAWPSDVVTGIPPCRSKRICGSWKKISDDENSCNFWNISKDIHIYIYIHGDPALHKGKKNHHL